RLGERVDVLTPVRGKGAAGHLWEQTALPVACGGRLLWTPGGGAPAFYGRQVVTIHDLFPIENPEWYSPAYARWYRFLLERLVARALHLITVSEYTRSRLVSRLGCDPERITVVPNGLTSGCVRVGEQAAGAARRELKLAPGRYVLSLSSLESRKNLRTILKAWALALPRLPADVWLVLAGPRADAAVYAREQLRADLPRVLFTGYVPDAHLAGLYSGASLFLFPSLAEGFGLPLLEAMACGLRSITSNTSSLPEVGGDVVTYVDPLDAAAMARQMEAELPRFAVPPVPFEPAMARARLFNWDRAAASTLETLERAACLLPAAAVAARSVPA
ncbi:MAG TPA: glycosyltransferase family 1 protein, partial [Acidobacteriaceae bacterium]